MKREELKVVDCQGCLYHNEHFFYIKYEADNVMDAMEARIKELENKNRNLQYSSDMWMACCKLMSEGKRNVMSSDALAEMNRIKELEAENNTLKADIEVLNDDCRIAKENEIKYHKAYLNELDENSRLKAVISKTENVDERREYAYEMDIVIRWLDKNEDFVTEPNGKMQLLKSKAMHQKIKWLDEHPRTPTTEESATEKENG